jgi:hypothetical protein
MGRLSVMSVVALQKVIAQEINEALDDDEVWGAFRCTAADGTEYVEVCKPDNSERYIITIVKGM